MFYQTIKPIYVQCGNPARPVINGIIYFLIFDCRFIVRQEAADANDS